MQGRNRFTKGYEFTQPKKLEALQTVDCFTGQTQARQTFIFLRILINLKHLQTSPFGKSEPFRGARIILSLVSILNTADRAIYLQF